MSVFTSPYNSPQAQHRRLLGVAVRYRDNAQTLKFTGLSVGGIGAVFVLMGPGIWSFLGLCLLGAALVVSRSWWKLAAGSRGGMVGWIRRRGQGRWVSGRGWASHRPVAW